MSKMYEDYERVYFSAADRQLENFLDENAFERSLLCNALFQPAILIPDIFFFISRGIERHVLESRTEQSFLEACIANGVAIPAFREHDCSSFKEAFYNIRGKGDPKLAIQGLRDPKSNDLLVDRLRIAERPGNFFDFTHWPLHEVGKKFEDVIRNRLRRQDPPQDDGSFSINRDDLDNLWKLTKQWRIGCVDEALEKTR